MKLPFTNHRLIKSASYSITKHSLNIFVNFRDKWPEFNIYSGTIHGLTVNNDGDDMNYDFDEIFFLPETDEEKELIDGIRFQIMNKDQLWIMYTKDEVWKAEDRKLVKKSISRNDIDKIRNEYLLKGYK